MNRSSSVLPTDGKTDIQTDNAHALHAGRDDQPTARARRNSGMLTMPARLGQADSSILHRRCCAKRHSRWQNYSRTGSIGAGTETVNLTSLTIHECASPRYVTPPGRQCSVRYAIFRYPSHRPAPAKSRAPRGQTVSNPPAEGHLYS